LPGLLTGARPHRPVQGETPTGCWWHRFSTCAPHTVTDASLAVAPYPGLRDRNRLPCGLRARTLTHSRCLPNPSHPNARRQPPNRPGQPRRTARTGRPGQGVVPLSGSAGGGASRTSKRQFVRVTPLSDPDGSPFTAGTPSQTGSSPHAAGSARWGPRPETPRTTTRARPPRAGSPATARTSGGPCRP